MSGGKINFSTSNLKFDVDNYSQYTKKEYSNNFSNTTYEEIDYNVDAINISEEKVNKNNESDNNSINPTTIANITSIISNIPNIGEKKPDELAVSSNITSVIPTLAGILGENKTEPLTPEEIAKKVQEETIENFKKAVGIISGTYSHIEDEEDIREFLKVSRKQEEDMDSVIKVLNKTKTVENGEIDSVEYRECKFNFKDGICESVELDNGLKLEIKYDENGKYDGYICKDGDKSLSIFRENNIESDQYGGTQMAFSWNNAELLEDRKIISILKKIYPNGDMEDYELLLARISNSGCGYTAMVNAVFQEYKGKEKEFEEKFGYPMYKVDAKGNLDYNYEYLIVEAFSSIWKNKGYSVQELAADMEDVSWEDGAVSGDTGDISTGTNGEIAKAFADFLKKEYGLKNAECYRNIIFDEDDNSWVSDLLNINISKEIGLDKYKIKNSINEIKDLYNKGDGQIILAVSGYDLYDMEGNLDTEDGGGHAMYITGITKDGDFIVSSWGEKFICKLDGADRIGYYYIDM